MEQSAESDKPDSSRRYEKEARKGSPGVFRVNELEWWLAYSLDEAVECAARRAGLPKEEILDELFPAYEVVGNELINTVDIDGKNLVELAKEMMEEFGEPPLMLMAVPITMSRTGS